MFISDQLKQLIKANNTSIKDVAKEMKVSRQYLSRLLNSKTDDISLKQLKSVCKVLGYTVDIDITH